MDNLEKCATGFRLDATFSPIRRAFLTTLDAVNTAPYAKPWRVLASLSWVGIILCQLAVAITGRSIGKSAWWIGPESNPSFPLLWVLPFAVSIAGLIATQRPHKFTLLIHLGCVALLVAIAAGNLSVSPGIAAIEFVIAGIALLVSFISMAARP